MKIVEYGKENKDVIILLHGGGLSWWNYRDEAELLQNEFHVILPILDGHSNSDRSFTSIEANALEIIEYVDTYYNGSVLLIGGVSLGAQIVIEILSKRMDICKYSIIESALVIPMKLTNKLVKPMLDMSYGLIKKKWFAKLQFESLKIKKELFDEYYTDTCSITKESMVAFLKANSRYMIHEKIGNTKAKVYIFVGQKEQKSMIDSAYKLNQLIPNSVLEIKEGMYHGEYSLNHAEEYVDSVRSIL